MNVVFERRLSFFMMALIINISQLACRYLITCSRSVQNQILSFFQLEYFLSDLICLFIVNKPNFLFFHMPISSLTANPGSRGPINRLPSLIFLLGKHFLLIFQNLNDLMNISVGLRLNFF